MDDGGEVDDQIELIERAQRAEMKEEGHEDRVRTDDVG
jgi:hypothetical protein